MQFENTSVRDALVLHPEPHVDERGFFTRVWCSSEFSSAGLDHRVAQSSISRNSRRGTLRGLHYQRPPHEETKVVRCVRGAIYDIIVDLRPESDTWRQWFAIELNAIEGVGLYVPPGVAHGFQTLVDDTDVLYMISVAYEPASASGVAWNDPAFDIVWPEVDRRTLSERDANWPPYDPARSLRTRGT